MLFARAGFVQFDLSYIMAEFELDIRSIQDQDSALTIVEIFLDSALDEKGLRKEFVHSFFNNVLSNLESQSASPKTKFYSLFIIKEMSLKDKITLKIFGTFSQHPLYSYLQELALSVDPKKPITEKGKNLYPSDKQSGNNLMRLLLESFVTWGTKFPTNNKKEPTKFKKTLTRLIDEKVVMPKEFIYYNANQKKSQKVQTPQGPKESISSKGVSSQSITKNPSLPAVKQPKQKLAGDIKFMYNKIQTLLGILEDSDSIEQIQREIQSYRLKFDKDLLRLEEIQSQILQNKDEQLVQQYFKILQFLQDQKELHKGHIPRNQYDTYISGYTIAYEKIFQEKKSQIKKPIKNEPSIDKKLGDQKSSSTIKSGLPPPPQKKVEKVQSHQQDIPSDKQNIKKGSGKDSQMQKPRQSKISDNKHAIEAYFNKLQNHSKSPHQGFGSITKSLGKQKTTTVSRLKTSNIANLNKSKMTTEQFTKSRLKGIFAEPPNVNVKPKTYQGQLVIQNEQLMRQNDKIRKDQGIRRLKASLFKNKYILYEDQNIQIGFKSSPIYEKVQKFEVMLNFEMFFGNKTKNSINKFQVSFQGDKQSLIYTNPQTIDSTIPPESQSKLDLLNIPKEKSFGLITLNASYQLFGQKCSIIALLPNSILQMAVYFDLDQKSLQPLWSQCPKILKTQQFKLSHYFPPDQFTHLLPKLKEKMPYSKFAKEGGTLDYELFCEVVLQEKYQAALKIIVRPDLNVVLQVGLYTIEEDSAYAFKFYLQSLQMALVEVEN